MCVCVCAACCLPLFVCRSSELAAFAVRASFKEPSRVFMQLFSDFLPEHTHTQTHIRLWLRDRSVVSETGASMRRLWQLQLQVQHVAAAGFQF